MHTLFQNPKQTLCILLFSFRALISNPSNYTYIPLKNNSYINIFPLKTNTFSLSFQLNNIIITFFSNFHSQPLSKYIKNYNW
ncbi:hypothetical protein Hanom_Chr03g00216531 [Helianthus anomalus]